MELAEAYPNIDRTLDIFRQTFEITQGDVLRKGPKDNFQRDIYIWLRLNGKLNEEDLPVRIPDEKVVRVAPPNIHLDVGSYNEAYAAVTIHGEWENLLSVFDDRAMPYKDNNDVVKRISGRWIDAEIFYQNKKREGRPAKDKVESDSKFDIYGSVLRRLVLKRQKNPTSEVYAELYDGVERNLQLWKGYMGKEDFEIEQAGFSVSNVRNLEKLITLWEKRHEGEKFFID